MAIGDAFSTDELTAFEWANFCRATDTHPTLLIKELQRCARLINSKLPSVQQAADQAGAVPELTRKISEIVGQQCKRQLTIAPEIRQMMDLT